MKTKLKFTTANIKAIPPNDKNSPSTEKEYSDIEVTGLKLLSGKNGSKRFLFRYRFQSKKASISIGSFPDIDLSKARKIARKHKTQLAEGINPKAERNAKTLSPTVAEFFNNTYLPLAKKRKRTWNDDLSRFNNHCGSIKNIPYDELTANHVMQLHLNMSESSNKFRPYSTATCNRVLALLKTMGKLANKLLDIPNVAGKVSLLPEDNARTRYCSIDETKRIIDAALQYESIHTGSFIALLFLLGCRESELRERKWDDLDIINKTLKIPRTKNGTYHILYLSELMMDIIKKLPRLSGNPYIFIGRFKNRCIGRPHHAFDIIKKVAHIDTPELVLLHTARHSVASNLISNGVDISSVQKLLNHRSIESTLRYAKLSEGKQRETSARISNMITAESLCSVSSLPK
ncbi:site-specific integrase [uncultured Psychromonas sp.]|uniref:site-specific integrase n=1 Tax=uncultured Psychromonas sp. TaxID=173974 RepID=UPI002630E51F|nr:site-specific integrase [uncultured Psychromonas sp.]